MAADEAHTDVEVAFLPSGACVIAGGYMVDEEAWSPSGMVAVDDRKYLKLAKSNRKLRALCGCSLTFDKFLDDLMESRNAEIDRIVLETAKQHDPLGREPSKRKGARETFTGGSGAPESVQVTIPSSPEPISVAVLWTYDKKCCVSIQLTEDATALNAIVNAVHDQAQEGRRGRKRCRDERVAFEWKDVNWNYERGSAYVRWRDEDGAWHTKHKKAEENKYMTAEAVAEARNTAAAELHEFYVKNHVPPM